MLKVLLNRSLCQDVSQLLQIKYAVISFFSLRPLLCTVSTYHISLRNISFQYVSHAIYQQGTRKSLNSFHGLDRPVPPPELYTPVGLGYFSVDDLLVMEIKKRVCLE